jgi:hypothetical protein
MTMQVKDLTIDELKTIIRETVQDSLAALVKELNSNSNPGKMSAEARAIDRLADIDAPSRWITTIEAGEEIDETALNSWLTTRGYSIQNSD